jgi:glutamine cyclotransferase
MQAELKIYLFVMLSFNVQIVHLMPMKRILTLCYSLISFVFLAACGDNDQPAEDVEDTGIPAPTTLTFQVLNQFKHDTAAFTEGLSFYNGTLYESTGSPDEPSNNGTWIGSIDLKTGKYDRKVDLGKSFFGEGITFLNNKVYQLTYKTQVGFIYDAKTFKKLGDFKYKSEGWGLTNDGNSLIMSAGTSNIYYLTPDSIAFTRMLAVQDNTGYVNNINELEFIGGYIYANKWLTNEILKIDTSTGYVVARLDLSKQVAEVKTRHPGAQELNGIAHDSASGKTYITGKKWPVIYEIRW